MAPGARMALVYTMLFAWVGVYMPYFPGWLASRGLSGTEVGVLLGLVPWLRLTLNPSLGQIADRTGRARSLLVVSALCCALGLAIYPHFDTFAGYVFSSLVVGASFAPLVPLADGAGVREAREGRMDYPRVRSAGSISFIVVVVATGYAVRDEGYEIIPFVALALALGIAAAGLLLPPERPADAVDASRVEPPRRRAGFLEVMRRPGVLPFLVGTALIQSSHAVVYNFGTIHWQQSGVGQDLIGALWAIGVVAEVALFAVGSRIVMRFGPARLMLVAGLGAAMRWFLLAGATSLVPLFCAQSLHALSFALLHLGALEFIRREIPEQHTATGLYSAAGPGIGMGVATPLAGLLFDAVGGAAFLAASVTALLGSAVVMSLVRREASGAAGQPC